MNKETDHLVIVVLTNMRQEGLYKNGELVVAEDSIVLSDVFEWFGDEPFRLTRAWSNADFVAFPSALEEFKNTFVATQGHFLEESYCVPVEVMPY